MEKHTWHKVALHRQSKEPSPRWGHCSTTRNHEIIYFGGYADSSYMSETWAFDTLTMSWKQIKTGGDVPSVRSNCTAHYDSHSDSVIVVGGGGPNKQRFNTISILNWDTKIWTQAKPDFNDPSPWERTYHSSAFLYPYIVVFGGEGMADLDDLWAYNIENKRWKEVKVKRNQAKPCARRFHTSVFLGNDFYVIAGCHGKYRSMGDIWKIDLTSLFSTGETDDFEWKQLKLKGSSFLTRWGHTSAVFQDKIYVFGGRFCNDLQDIIVIDPERSSLKNFRACGMIPKARRRHASAFIGSSMVIFGGFNGQYFNDLNYINVFEAKSKNLRLQNTRDIDVINWVGKQTLSDGEILTNDNQVVKIHRGLMANRFQNEASFQCFLEFVHKKYSSEEVKEIIEIIYLGAGTLPSQLSLFDLQLFENTSERNQSLRRLINPLENQSLTVNIKQKEVFYLSQENYSAYLERFHQNQHYDLLLAMGEDCIPVNKTQLAINSRYFELMSKDIRNDTLDFNCQHSFIDSRIFQVLVNYLQSGYLVVPQQLDEECWILLYELAEYICLPTLMKYCEHELSQLLNENNCQKLLGYSSKNAMQVLSAASAELYLSLVHAKNNPINLTLLRDKTNRSESEQILSKLLAMSKFDMDQREKREAGVFSELNKRHSENNIEKENQIE